MTMPVRPETDRRIDELKAAFPRPGSALLPALYLVQEEKGHIPEEAMVYLAGKIGVAPAFVAGVVSFYTLFHAKPVGRHHIQLCRTLPCALRGAERVTEALTAALGTEPNGTDPSGTFTLMEVECLGACDRAPLVMVNDAWHERLTPEDAPRLVDDLRARGQAAVSGCHHVIEQRKP